ncbi:MAG: RNA polymerase sigma-54 factor [Desulfococcus sp. 4484_241]|nr:MAG: RNA polymerase sigma-54 factor [Desulfococcus sp. 4484_241]
MALDLRQNLKLTQQLIMTPQLQMAIRLLQLNRLELVETIQQEMVENPVLEESIETGEKTGDDEIEPGDIDITKEVLIEDKITDQVEWENYLNEYNSYGRAHFESETREQPRYESFIASKGSLRDHLLWQFVMTRPSAEEERIASLIIGNVDDDGYLKASIEDIASDAKVPEAKAERVLSTIQEFDPPGVCARDLPECLLIQARQLGINTPLMEAIIKHHLKMLETKNYAAIAKALKTNRETAMAAIKAVLSLEPRPGRAFSEEDVRYIVPDVYVYKFEDDFVILLNDDGLPRLHINPYYRQTIRSGGAVSPEAREYLREKIRSASWLIKSIQQRQKTIYAVMQSILKFQRDFFEKGVEHLKPLVLKDVAEDIGMHESTISRVTTNKYAHTPQGIFELKYFFNSSIGRTGGDAMASASVKEKIRRIIKQEDPKKPYSDEAISEMLKKSGINIARRTVTKYREALGILPSVKRKHM